MKPSDTALRTVFCLVLTLTIQMALAEKKADLAKGWGVNEEAAILELWPKAARPRMLVPKVAQAPKVDGKPDDACWAGASRIDFFISCKGFGSKPPLRFGVDELLGKTWTRLCYDDQNLYAYVYCQEEHVGWLQTSEKRRDGATWKDDCVEFFVDTNRDRKTVVHAIINPAPTLYDAFEGTGKGSGREWNFEGEQIKVDVGEDYWALEVAFPLKSLGGAPAEGDVWGFNVCRQRRASGQVAIWSYGTWTGNPEGFQEPDQMGDLVFGAGASQAVVPPEPFFGRSEFGFTIRNDSAKALDLNAWVEVVSATKRSQSEPIKLKVAPATSGKAQVPFTIRDEGLQFATLVVARGEDQLLVQRRGLYIRPVTPTLDSIQPRAEKLMAKADDENFKESIGRYLAELSEVRQAVEAFKAKLIPATSDLANYAEWLKLYNRAKSFSGQSTYVVWTKNPFLPTSPNDFPARMEDVEEIVLRVAANEWEHAALMVSNLTDEPLNLIVKGVPRGLVDVRAPLATHMETVVAENPDAMKYETVRGFNLPGKTGEPLVRLGQLRELVLMPLSTRQLFLTFSTADLKPGTKTGGSLSFYTLNKSYGVKRVRVTLDIQPFELPTDAELGVHCYNYSSSDYHLRDLRSHKVNLIFGADYGKFVLKNGKFEHQVDRAAKDAMKRLRLGGRKGWAYGFCNQYHEWAAKQKLKPGDPKYEEYWRQSVRSLVEAFRGAGFKDGEYYIGAWDEVKAGNVDLCVDLLRMLKEEAPHLKVANTIQCSKDEQRKQMPYVDAWVAAGGFYWDAKMAEELRKAGKELMAYTCSTPVRAQNPLGYYRMAGWRAARCQMAGISFFAYTYLIYDIDGEVVPTRGWEAWRQGVEDWQYWNLHRKEVVRVREAGKAEAADASEASVKEAMDALFKLGTHPKDSPELAAAMELARAQIAAEITKLQKTR